ncbi:MAG: hypothetical protein AAFR44_16715, partial [Pseudomonadota bacterium]
MSWHTISAVNRSADDIVEHLRSIDLHMARYGVPVDGRARALALREPALREWWGFTEAHLLDEGCLDGLSREERYQLVRVHVVIQYADELPASPMRRFLRLRRGTSTLKAFVSDLSRLYARLTPDERQGVGTLEEQLLNRLRLHGDTAAEGAMRLRLAEMRAEHPDTLVRLRAAANSADDDLDAAEAHGAAARLAAVDLSEAYRGRGRGCLAASEQEESGSNSPSPGPAFARARGKSDRSASPATQARAKGFEFGKQEPAAIKAR